MIVSLGSINADFVLRVDAVPDGPGARLGRDLLRTSGGKAANVAVLAVRLGTSARLLGCVGSDDLAAQALAGPVACGVDVSGVRRVDGPTAYSSVVVPPDGKKAIVVALNANDAVPVDAVDVDGASVVVADLEMPPAVAAAALRAGRAAGAVTVLDPAPPDRLDPSVLAVVDHLTPDQSEALELAGVDEPLPAAVELRRRGAGVVHVKLADGGSVVAAPDGCWRLTAPPVEVVDATGAGDAYTGGLAWALHEGLGVVDAARVAVAASTIAVTGYGSQESYPADRAALDAMVERVEVGRA